MDGSFMAADYGSTGKAVAAAAFGRPSGELAAMADGPLVRGIDRAGGSTGPGDRPGRGRAHDPERGRHADYAGGITVGACGVGGASDEQDEECATA